MNSPSLVAGNGKGYHLRLTPSLFNAFSWWQRSVGEPYELSAYQSLMAALCHTPTPSTEATQRGTMLNNVIDHYLVYGSAPLSGAGWMGDVTPDGTIYSYDEDLVHAVIERLKAYGAGVEQMYSAHTMTTRGGVAVKLYGYADYVSTTMVIDLKTTDNYTAGKYRGGWQHFIYPYTLMMSALLDPRTYEGFDYLVVECKKDKDGIYRGEIYTESYQHGLKECRDAIDTYLDTELLPFIAQHRDELTSYIFD